MNPEELILRVPAILLALTVHEFAHGYVALKRGDSTAHDAGRLTLNPIAHLDPFGAIMLLFGPFGWAKPVPVNSYNLKNPKSDIIWVSLAGPASNILLAIVIGYTVRVLDAVVPGLLSNHPYMIEFIRKCIEINIGLAFFNLIPIPPLDGSQILAGILPDRWVASYYERMKYAPLVFMGLIVAEWMFHIRILSAILYPLYLPFASFWQFVIFWR